MILDHDISKAQRYLYLTHWSNRTNPINTNVMIRTILFSSCLKISSLPSSGSWVSPSLIVDELLTSTEPIPSFHITIRWKTYHWIYSISTFKPTSNWGSIWISSLTIFGLNVTFVQFQILYCFFLLARMRWKLIVSYPQ